MERVRIVDPLELIRKQALAERLGVSPWTLMRWCQEGRFPPPIRLTENTIGWRRRDVEAWLRQKERQHA